MIPMGNITFNSLLFCIKVPLGHGNRRCMQQLSSKATLGSKLHC